MEIKYEDLEITVNHTNNMVDRQEFVMKIVRKGKVYRFYLEGAKPEPEEPAIWKLYLTGTPHRKIVGSMRNADLYRDVVELMEKNV